MRSAVIRLALLGICVGVIVVLLLLNPATGTESGALHIACSDYALCPLKSRNVSTLVCVGGGGGTPINGYDYFTLPAAVRTFSIADSEALVIFETGEAGMLFFETRRTVPVEIGTGRVVVQISSTTSSIHCLRLDDDSVLCFYKQNILSQLQLPAMLPIEISAPGTAAFVAVLPNQDNSAFVEGVGLLLKKNATDTFYRYRIHPYIEGDFILPNPDDRVSEDFPLLLSVFKLPYDYSAQSLFSVCNGSKPVRLVTKDTTIKPLPTSSDSDAIRAVVEGSAYHTCLVRTDGQLFCHGTGSDGQLCSGQTSSSPSYNGGWSQSLSFGASVMKGSASKYKTCVILSTGEVKCCGKMYPQGPIMLLPQAINLTIPNDPDAPGPAPDQTALIGAVVGSIVALLMFALVLGGIVHRKRQERRRIQQLLFASTPATTVFLTHDWGQDVMLTNHRRVSALNDELRKRGISTWFDSERLTGDIMEQILVGVDRTQLVAVCLTKRYMDKVAKPPSAKVDYCQVEFKYALRRKGPERMLLIVMEPEMRDSALWFGPVAGILGDMLFVDYSSDDLLQTAAEQIANLVSSRLKDLGLDAVEVTGNQIVPKMSASAM
jgi:hypothetical protein